MIKETHRVLVLVGRYLPGYKAGGPVRSIANIVSALGEELDFTVITGDRDLGDDTAYPDIRPGQAYRVGNALVYYIAPGLAGVACAVRLLRRLEYDTLYLNSLFSPVFTVLPLVLRWLGIVRRVPLVVAPRGELAASALSIKPLKKRIYFGLASVLGLYKDATLQATSEHDANDIRRAFPNGKVELISELTVPGVSQGRASTCPKAVGELRIVFMSRIAPIKNLRYILERLHSVPGRVSLDIVGPVEDDRYWGKCLSQARQLPDSVQVRYLGPIEHSLVSETLAQYDVFFLPTLGENHGHAILEALCAGCPALISNRTPWNDLQAHGAGWSIPLENPAEFEDVIRHLLQCDSDAWRATSQRAREYGLSHAQRPSTLISYLRVLGAGHVGTDRPEEREQ